MITKAAIIEIQALTEVMLTLQWFQILYSGVLLQAILIILLIVFGKTLIHLDTIIRTWYHQQVIHFLDFGEVYT